MLRLSTYLARQFARESLGFFLVAASLVWITQTLRLFDLVTAKGQDIFTLLGQSLLTTPPLALAIAYICMGIGMARVMARLQATRELHTIHVAGRVPALWGGFWMFVFGGVLAVSLIAHYADPWSKTAYEDWTAEIAADLVGRTLSPNRFAEAAPGVIVVIGGRESDGSVIDFFADDSRDPNLRRTYMAKRAFITKNGEDFSMSLENGALQYVRAGDRFTQIAFNRYELSFENFLTANADSRDDIDRFTSVQLLERAQSDNAPLDAIIGELYTRNAEAARVIALLLLVAALTFFPHGRRAGFKIPIEATVLAAGLGERVVTTLAPRSLIWAQYSGALVLLVLATLVLAFRLRPITFLAHARRTG